MTVMSNLVRSTVASLLLAVGFSLPALGQEATEEALEEGSRLDRLYASLAEAEPGADQRILREIFTEWGKSGSPTVDLLLERGKDALDAGELDAAIDHLTAAIDYAPDFAEPYHLRATAYYLTGRIGPSLADLGRALALEPRHFRALRGFAVLLEELGEPARALEVLEALLVLYPADLEARAAAERLSAALEGQSL